MKLAALTLIILAAMAYPPDHLGEPRIVPQLKGRACVEWLNGSTLRNETFDAEGHPHFAAGYCATPSSSATPSPTRTP